MAHFGLLGIHVIYDKTGLVRLQQMARRVKSQILVGVRLKNVSQPVRQVEQVI